MLTEEHIGPPPSLSATVCS